MSPNDTNTHKRSGMTFETLAVSAFVFGIFAIVAAVFAVGLAARAVSESRGGGGSGGSGAATTGGGPTVDKVSLGEFFIKPETATVAAHSTLTIKNEGSVQHDLSIDGKVTSAMLDPGKEGTLEVGDIAPGTYKWYCTVPGHEAAGMKGQVTVK